MESMAVTLRKACLSDGVSPEVRPNTNFKSSALLCITLNDVCISALWEHQKKDFIEANSKKYLTPITDEVFAFHLLQIHAKFCIEQPETLCKCRCSAVGNSAQLNHDVIENEQSGLSPRMTIKSEPNFANTSASSTTDILHDPDETTFNSKLSPALKQESFTDASPEGFQFQHVLMNHGSEGFIAYNTSEYLVCEHEKKTCLSSMAQNPSENIVKHVKPVTNTNLFCGVSAYGPSEVASNFDELPEDNLCAENDRMHGVASGIESPDVSHDQQKELVPLIIKTEEETSFEGPSEVASHFYELPENNLCTKNYRTEGVESGIESPDVSHDQEIALVPLKIKTEEGTTFEVGPSEVASHFDELTEDNLWTENDRTQGVASGIESPDVSHDQKELVPLIMKTEEGTTFEGYNEHFDTQEPLSSRVIQSEVPKMKTAKIVLQKLDVKGTISKCVDCHKVLQGSSIQCSGDGTVNRRILKCNRCKKSEKKEAGHQSRDTGEDILGLKTNHLRHGATMGQDVGSLTNDSENPGHQLGENDNLASTPSSLYTEMIQLQRHSTEQTCVKLTSKPNFFKGR